MIFQVPALVSAPKLALVTELGGALVDQPHGHGLDLGTPGKAMGGSADLSRLSRSELR